jgi:hypothetical protein
MHEYLKRHPWLIQPQWETLQHEKTLGTVLVKEFQQKKVKSQTSAGRVDFFCLATANQWEVVELKRPGATVGVKELNQVRDYVFFLRTHAGKTTDPAYHVPLVHGILIYSDIASGLSEHIDNLRQGGVYTRTWQDLLRTTESLHREFLEVVKRRAPTGDPRITELDELNSA